MATPSPLPTAPSKLRVGCVGGGQLGRMMALESPRLNIDMRFLDAAGPECPAGQVLGATDSRGVERVVTGALYDEHKLGELAEGCDVITMEIEHVGVEGLEKLEKKGVNVQPSSRVISIIQDKFVQKVSEDNTKCCCAAIPLAFATTCHVLILELNISGALFQTLHSPPTIHKHP